MSSTTEASKGFNDGRHMLLTGNYAVAYGAKLSRPDLIPVYPITPQTPIAEKLTQLKSKNEITADIMTVESEHSAMAACIAASAFGSRVFTATSSHGLMYMHEMLHWAVGCRAPVVMANVNRTMAPPWAFFADHFDSLSQRDTGWLQLYCASNQEALDSTILAFKLAEQVLLPVMVVLEATYLSHTLEPVLVPEQELVDAFLPPFAGARFDMNTSMAIGNAVKPAEHKLHRQQIHRDSLRAIEVYREAALEWGRLTGRHYPAIDYYRCDDAETIAVAGGGIASTTQVAIDQLRDKGQKIGLATLKLFRPFPVEDLRQVLGRAAKVVVIDRDLAAGLGGIFHQEVKAALMGAQHLPQVCGVTAGLGGTNVSVQQIENLLARMHAMDAYPSESVDMEDLL